MRIHPPTLEISGEDVVVSAGIDITGSEDFPARLWFRFPVAFAGSVCDRMEAFVAALLLLAMVRGEDLFVDGPLSEKFLFGVREYQRIFQGWMPERFRLVNIIPTGKDRYCGNGRGVGGAFSGGADSFFTLWRHLADNEPEPGYALTHLLFMRGFDLPHDDARHYPECAESYGQMAERLGVRLITGSTNIRDFVEPVCWDYAHGSAVLAAALVLQPLFSVFYIPGAHGLRDIHPNGATPLTDPLLSTHGMEVVHDGLTFSRTDKLAVIAEWPETYSQLRVCWEHPNGVNNCCRCHKCVRTMTTLQILGRLDRYETFSRPLPGLGLGLGCSMTPKERKFAKQNLRLALRHGRSDIARRLRPMLWASRFLHPLRRRAGNVWRRLERLNPSSRRTLPSVQSVQAPVSP